MLLIFAIVAMLPVWFLCYCLNVKLRNKANPASIMVYIWSVMLLLAVSIGKKWGYYPMDASGIIIVSLFLFCIIFSVYLFSRKDSLGTKTYSTHVTMEWINVNDMVLYKVTLFLFALFIISQVIYFVRLNSYIPLLSLPANIWKWKNLILTGQFSESSPLYFPRDFSMLGTIISLCYIQNKGKKRSKVMLMILVIYSVLSFMNPRRDPILVKMIYILSPFIYVYRNRMKKIIVKCAPFLAVFAVLFFFTYNALTFGSGSIQRAIGSYTFGAFNSLQKAIDVGYSEESNIFWGNTFYFVYMFLKYLVPSLAPPNIVLESLGTDTTNVYTALIAPLIDANGSVFMFIVTMLLYAFYIGAVMAVSINIFSTKRDVPSFCFYSAVFACSIRTFYNPTFSWSDIVFAAVYAVILQMILKRNPKRVQVE